MSQLQDKFDRIPQEIDRMAIWKGIARPKRKFPFRILWGTAILLILGLTGVYVTGTESTPTEEIRATPESQETPGRSVEVISKKLISEVERQESEGKALVENSPMATVESIPSPDSPEMQRETDQGMMRSSSQAILSHLMKEVLVSKKEVQYSLEAVRTSLYSLSIPVQLPQQPTFDSPIPIDPEAASSRSQSLSLSVGMGTHLSSFTTSALEGTNWRSELERPQTDLTASLRYEKMLKRNFLVSAVLSYDLYKDQIVTTYLRDSANQFDRIDYELYNHYQVLSGQVLLGRRWVKKSYFWDVLAGPGVKLHQSTETDYFVREGQLASEEEIKAVYHRSMDIFGTGQAAVGRYLGQRSFLRAGFRMNAALDLSVPDSPIRHRVSSFQPFVEAGVRF